MEVENGQSFPIVEPFQLHSDSYTLAWNALKETCDKGWNTYENRLILQLQRLPKLPDGTHCESVLAHIHKMRSLVQLATTNDQHEYHLR